ncbi:MAG: methyltransferase domain-containing protein [Pseudomonadota bacterium]
MTDNQMREPQYQRMLDGDGVESRTRLGLMINYAWADDPKRLAFTFARYKFVAKMLEGTDRVLEIGCGDGFVSRVVAQSVGALTAVDFDQVFITDAKALATTERWPITFQQHDILEGPVAGPFDAAFSMDVMEHIEPDREDAYLANIAAGLTDHGTFIAGMPSLESQAYASVASREGHVNCKTGPDLKAALGRYFHTVFLFSMNDEVVHTGYHKMAHYLIAIGVGPRR